MKIFHIYSLIYIKSALFFPLVSPQIIFETDWIDSPDCNTTPPTRMLTFDAKVTSTTFYDFYNEYGIPSPICGSNPIPNPEKCCLKSLLPNASFYLSANIVSLSEESGVALNPLDSQVSAWANGAEYCLLQKSGGDASGFPYSYSYQSAWYLASSRNYCIDSLICNATALYLFSDESCASLLQSVSLSVSPKTVNFDTSSVSASRVIITNASQMMNWIAYTPNSDYVPDYRDPVQGFGLACFILGTIISFTTSGYTVYTFFVSGTRNMNPVVTIVRFFLWGMWVIGNYCFWVVKFPDNTSWQILNLFLNILFNLLSYQNIIETIALLIKFFHIDDKRHQYAIWVTLAVSHIGLCGGAYLVLLQYSEDAATADFTFHWFYAFPIWVFLEYTINTIPPIVMMLRLLRDDQAKRREKSIVPALQHSLVKDQKFYYFVACQITNTVIYCIVRYLDNYSNVLYDDLKWSAVANGVEPLVHVIHVFCNLIITSELQAILIRKSKKSSSVAKKSKMLKKASILKSKTSSSGKVLGANPAAANPPSTNRNSGISFAVARSAKSIPPANSSAIEESDLE